MKKAIQSQQNRLLWKSGMKKKANNVRDTVNIWKEVICTINFFPTRRIMRVAWPYAWSWRYCPHCEARRWQRHAAEDTFSSEGTGELLRVGGEMNGAKITAVLEARHWGGGLPARRTKTQNLKKPILCCTWNPNTVDLNVSTKTWKGSRQMNMFARWMAPQVLDSNLQP